MKSINPNSSKKEERKRSNTILNQPNKSSQNKICFKIKIPSHLILKFTDSETTSLYKFKKNLLQWAEIFPSPEEVDLNENSSLFIKPYGSNLTIAKVDNNASFLEFFQQIKSQDTVELSLDYYYPLLLVNYKHRVQILVPTHNLTFTLIFDEYTIVEDIIRILLENLPETYSFYSFELQLQVKDKDSPIPLDYKRKLHSFKFSFQDKLILTKKNDNFLPLIRRIYTENTNSNSNSGFLFNITVLIPNLQIYTSLQVNSSNSSYQHIRNAILQKIFIDRFYFQKIQTEDFSDYELKIVHNNEVILFKEDEELSSIINEPNISLEFCKQENCSRIILLQSHHYCVKLSFLLAQPLNAKLLICSAPTNISVYEIVTFLKDFLSKETEQNFDYFGIYDPSKDVKGNDESLSSSWLKFDQKLIQCPHKEEGWEFKEDSKYSSLMNAAAKIFSSTLTPTLLSGEKILFKKDHTSHLVNLVGKISGVLYLTNYRIIFSPYDHSTYDDAQTIEATNIPILTIDSIEDFGSGEQCGIQIVGKDLRDLIFGFNQESKNQFLKFIKDLISISSIEQVFAFSNKEQYNALGWNIYDPIAEYKRQGVIPSSSWRISYANSTYSLCSTYPQILLVPNAISDQDLKSIADFRSKGRLPVTCWIHPHNKASLTRCAQPRSGLTRSRCSQDEALVNAIVKLNSNSPFLYFVDSRPVANAIANTFMGHGSEDTELYQNCKMRFLGVGNIHVMTESFHKLKEICRFGKDSNTWLSDLQATRWLDNIKQILEGVVTMVELIDKRGYSVITHCSDGWDRTSQLCALAQLILDPYYRTCLGFQILIEKEWVGFGHKFLDRCGHGLRKSSEESPVFVMFIECVWQITRQFPCSFQFNEHFLITILDHLYSCRFGTFLFNSERERKENQADIKTPSLWSYINSNIIQFLNPHYSHNDRVLYPIVDIRKVELWVNYYLRWDKRMRQQESIDQKTRKLEDSLEKLRKRFDELQQQK